MVYFNTHRFSVGVVFISSNWGPQSIALRFALKTVHRTVFLTGSQFSKSKLFCLEEGICKNFVVLFTFWNIYGIIILGSDLLDKLEFGEVIL